MILSIVSLALTGFWGAVLFLAFILVGYIGAGHQLAMGFAAFVAMILVFVSGGVLVNYTKDWPRWK